MDFIGIRQKLRPWMQKYKYVLLVLAVGVVLMLIPTGVDAGKDTAASPEISTQPKEESIDTQLAKLLSQIDGVGEARVLLTVAAGEEILYQTDTQASQEQSRVETVIVTGSDRAQTGLVRQVNPAVYRGAVIVCRGGDKASVRLAVVEAVSSLTGLGADQISVLKMK